jgi:HEAT repeat protein
MLCASGAGCLSCNVRRKFMPNWVKSMLVVVMITLACAIAALILHSREPEYEGKRLRLWLQDYEFGKDCPAAEKAVRNIGTNGLPTLLRLMAAQDHPAWSNVVHFASQHGIKRLDYIPADILHSQAWFGFHALGASASNAVPQLLKMYRPEPCFRHYALVLGEIGPPASNAIPALLFNLGNTNVAVRACAVRALGRIHCSAASVVPALTAALDDSVAEIRYEAVVALGLFEEEAKSAAPVLVRYLDSPTNYGVSQTVWALNQIHADPQMTLNVLLIMLHDPLPGRRHQDRRICGAAGLEVLGRAAPVAVPDLLQVLAERDLRPDVRQQVIQALKAIDPAAAAKAAVSPQPSAPL